MNLGKYILVFFILFFSIIVSHSQDIHFSQFLSSPINLNPSLAGDINKGNYRIVANHRNQWQSITTPYVTTSTSFDGKISAISIPKNYIATGISINSDKAGDSEFGTFQIHFIPALHHILKHDSSLVISLGIDFSFNQRTINYNKLTFSSQFNGKYYDPLLPTNEIFQKNNFSYLDLTLGTSLYQLLNKKYPLRIGLCFVHLLNPKQSFNDIEKVKLDGRFVSFFESDFSLNKKFNILPQLLYMKQGKYFELNLGGLVKQKLDNISFQAFYLGGWFRFRDAAIIKTGLDYKNITLGFSYDFNISKLNIASHGKGGGELSVVYIFDIPRPIPIPIHHQCPAYF